MPFVLLFTLALVELFVIVLAKFPKILLKFPIAGWSLVGLLLFPIGILARFPNKFNA